MPVDPQRTGVKVERRRERIAGGAFNLVNATRRDWLDSIKSDGVKVGPGQ